MAQGSSTTPTTMDKRSIALAIVALLCVGVVLYDGSRQRSSFYMDQKRSVDDRSMMSSQNGEDSHHQMRNTKIIKLEPGSYDDMDVAGPPETTLPPATTASKSTQGSSSPSATKPTTAAGNSNFSTLADELEKKDASSFNKTLEAELNAMAKEAGGGKEEESQEGATQQGAIDLSTLEKQHDNGWSCDYQLLRNVSKYSKAKKRWTFADPSKVDRDSDDGDAFSYNFCGGAVKLPISGDTLFKHFNGKKIVFLGDSVARNSFVLTTARLCNEVNMDKCITRMPTFDFDIRNPPHNSGPMGCVPRNGTSSSTSATTASMEDSVKGDGKDPEHILDGETGGGNMKHTMAKSECYRNGQFHEVYIRGLTTRFVPQDKAGRKQFLRKGMIGPALESKVRNITLIYLPITKPQHLFKTGVWMSRTGWPYLQGDVIIASIGPHLRFQEVEITPQTLPNGFAAIRRATKAPIIFAEFVHALRSQPQYIEYVDNLMEKLRKLLVPLGVTMVPQRQITLDGYVLRNSNVQKSDSEQADKKACGYYDVQHPAFRCQNAATELLLAAAIAKTLPPRKDS